MSNVGPNMTMLAVKSGEFCLKYPSMVTDVTYPPIKLHSFKRLLMKDNKISYLFQKMYIWILAIAYALGYIRLYCMEYLYTW